LPTVSARETSLVGRVIAGRYRLDERTIGDGVSTSFAATDVQLSRPVTVRILVDDLAQDGDFVRRFLAESQVAATLEHQNLERVEDWGAETVGGRSVVYLVVERLTGGTLQDVIDRGRLLSPSQALVVGLDVCRGLDFAHRRGIVHYDIRPSAIVFGDDRRARVAHLGMSRALSADVWANPSSVERERALYASPEQAQGRPVDERTDVYSLVLTLVQSVTGQLPFEAESSVATLSARVDRLMPVSADLGALAAVFEKAGRPDSADRSTAGELGRALVQVAPGLPRPSAVPIVGAATFEPAVAPLLDQSAPDTGARDDTRIVDDTVIVDDTSIVDDAGAVDEPAMPDEHPSAKHALRWLLAAAAVVVLVVGGVVLWRSASATRHEVPDLAGVPAGEAQNQISGLGWDIVVREEPHDEVSRGDVIRTEPASGSDLAEGDRLTLVVSSGPAPSILVDVVGMSEDEAVETLTAERLDVVVSDRPFDEDVERGVVISWDVPSQPGQLAAGEEVLTGTTVELVVSAGPEPRSVPDVVGLRLAQATERLEEQGLVLVRGGDVFSRAVPQGRVVRQSIEPGTSVDRGSEITVRISKGPELVAMPRLDGRDVAGVREALRDVGLRLGEVRGTRTRDVVDASVDGKVVVPGGLVPKGSVVDIRFRRSR
jgi:eukaryotic-like serine/threonine-protein kinase